MVSWPTFVPFTVPELRVEVITMADYPCHIHGLPMPCAACAAEQSAQQY